MKFDVFPVRLWIGDECFLGEDLVRERLDVVARSALAEALFGWLP